MNQIQLDSFSAHKQLLDDHFQIELRYNRNNLETKTIDADNPSTSALKLDTPDGFSPNHHELIIHQTVDFKTVMASMPESDVYDLVLKHRETDANGNTIMRHIVNAVDINDTRYPPPYGGKQRGPEISLHDAPPTTTLRIQQLTVERSLVSNLYKVDLVLEPKAPLEYGYKVVNDGVCAILNDTYNYTEMKPMQALVLFVRPVNPDVGDKTLSFSATDLDLAAFKSNGLPIVVTDQEPGSNFWESITLKKGVLAFH